MSNYNVRKKMKQINDGQISQTRSREERYNEAYLSGYEYIFFNPRLNADLFYDEELYIPYNNTHKQIDDFLSSGNQNITALIGYKGMGKTTLLKNYFHVSHLNIQCSDETKGVWVMPVLDWNKYTNYDDDCKLHLLFHEINQHLSIDGIHEKRESDLESKLAFEIRILKRILNEENISTLVIVLDNIESLPQETKTIGKFVKILQDLMRVEKKGDRISYSIKLLLSFTPERFVYECEKGSFSPLGEDGYPFKLIYLKERLDITDYLKAKILYSESTLNNPGDWMEFWKNEFRKLSRKYNGKYDDIILGISNYNYTQAFLTYADVLSNSRYLHSPCRKGALKYTKDAQFDLFSNSINNINVLRAIFCLEDEMFVSLNNSRKLCNFLHQDRHKDADNSMIMLLLLKMYVNISDKDNMYGESRHLKMGRAVSVFTTIFHSENLENTEEQETEISEEFKEFKDLKERVEECITFLYETGVLAKCCKAKPNEKHELNSESRLYLTVRGRTLWDMLTQDSVLLEMYREDYYRSIYNVNPYSSEVLMETNQQERLFLDVCELITKIAEKEKAFRDFAKDTDTDTAYRSVFGKDTIISHLFSGLNQSILFSGRNTKDGELGIACKKYFDAENDLMTIFSDKGTNPSNI